MWDPAESVDSTHKTDDEKEWQQEQRRKHRRGGSPHPVPESGPCCLRCRNWETPDKQGDFGTCHFLVTAQERRRPLFDKGHVIALAEAMEFGILYEFLPTRANFECSAFQAAEGEVAA